MLASALALVLSTPPAPPVGETLRLSWTAPADCPTEAEVRSAIDSYLGREEFGEEISEVEIAARIEPPGAERRSHRLHVSARLPGGIVERSVSAAHCAELAAAAGLVIAVALDPLRVSQAVQPGDERTPTVAPPPTPPAPVAAPERRSVAVDLRLGAAGEIGTLPRLGAGAWAAIAVVGRRFRAELAGHYWAPRVVRPFGTPAEAGASIQLGAAVARGCFVPAVGRLEFPSCLGVEAGAMRARGVGLQVERVSHRPWLAVVVGQELSWTSRRHVGLFLAVDGLLNVVRPRFAVDDLGTVLEAGWAGFRAIVGPSVRI